MPTNSAHPIKTWSTQHMPGAYLTDAWEDELSKSYGGWLADHAVDQGFSASIRRREFGGLRVVECECDPCSGQRLPPLIRRDTTPFIGVQITRSGSERFHFGDEALAVGAGDLVIWTSEHPTRFTVMERLHKVSLVLPWADLQELLPRSSRFTGTVLDSRHGIGAMLFSHVDNLARQMEGFSEDDQAAVRRATLELLGAALSHRVEVPQRGLAQRYLRQLQDYILRHLREESLSPGSIAAANHMSPRYVHMLFAQNGTSVSAWIRQQRLERCRQALESGAHRDSHIADIAYNWGFGDPSHFTRIFKQQYGLSPSDCRQEAARQRG